MCKVFEYRSNLFLYSFQNPFWFKTSFLIWEKKNSKASPTLWFPHSYKWYHAIGANGSTSKNKVPTSFSTKYFSVFFPDDFKNLIYVGKPWQFSGFPCLFTHLKHLKCVACECPLCIYKASWKHCATSQQQILLNRDACSTSWEYTASSKTLDSYLVYAGNFSRHPEPRDTMPCDQKDWSCCVNFGKDKDQRQSWLCDVLNC